MKIRIPAMAAALLCCLGCVKVNYELGGSLIPVDQTYKTYCDTIYFDDPDNPVIYMKMADSLSGYSQTRITIGSIIDEHGNESNRKCALTLIPMYQDSLDLGKNPRAIDFHFEAAFDTTSCADLNQKGILQNVYVHELSRALDPTKDFNCNSYSIETSDKSVIIGTPVINGADSLIFNFTKDFAQKYLSLTNDDVQDMDKFLKKCPGICIETNSQKSRGGRINMFESQLGFDSSYGLLGNFAYLDFTAEFDGEEKDTTLLLYYGALDFYDIDSLLNNGTAGSYPQYVLNLTKENTRNMTGPARSNLILEGGGGLKPVVNAKAMTDLVKERISQRCGGFDGTVINKASLIFPFEYDPDKWEENYKYTARVSPTCRIRTDTTASFMSLTDASASSENQGDIDRANLCYKPDISYHMQELLKMSDEKLSNGNYDIWLLTMANETVTESSSSSSSDLSEYYQYLAYQSYYNNMYGGYGYGGYSGYGSGYGSSYYNNYYSYMMASMYASSASSSTTSTEMELDKDRYYWGKLNAPADPKRPPMLIITYSVPNK